MRMCGACTCGACMCGACKRTCGACMCGACTCGACMCTCGVCMCGVCAVCACAVRAPVRCVHGNMRCVHVQCVRAADRVHGRHMRDAMHVTLCVHVRCGLNERI